MPDSIGIFIQLDALTMAGACYVTDCSSRGVPGDSALPWGAIVGAVAEGMIGRIRLYVLDDAVSKHLPPLLHQVRVHMSRVWGLRDMTDSALAR